MLQFSIGKIPVEVRASHLFFSFVLAFLFSQNAALPQPVALVSWVVVISISVLVHELGHAAVSLFFGYKPSIVLIAMGGYTLTPTEKPMPWLKDIVLTLAGPLAGYGLAVLFGLLAAGVPADNFAVLHYVFRSFLWANLVWSTFNLIPMGPLDGGRVAAILFARLSPKHGPLGAQVLGILCGVPLLLWALSSGSVFMAVFIGMFMLRSLWLSAELLRGDGPSVASSSAASASSEEELAHIQKLLEKGAYAEGLRQAENLLAGPLSPEESARAHLLAGWLAIKSNRGRKALNHFSQVQGLRVPPQAMAAALSLTGEDERALPLWEEAASESENPVLLHEWAGTMLRLGRGLEVRQMPYIRMSKAFLCAESVYRLRGEFSNAALAGEGAFNLEPQAEVAYQTACNYAAEGDDGNALRMLVLAAQNGFKESQRALAEPCLQRLHGLAAFQEWLKGL